MNEAFRPISIVSALWPTQDFQFPAEVEKLGEHLRQQAGQINEQLIINQPPPGPPQPEWPRLILLGDQQRLALEVAAAKITLRRTINNALDLTEVFEAHWTLLSPIHAWLAENLDFRVYRIGSVLQFFCNTRSSANEKIANYFLNPRAGLGQTPHDVNLNFLHRLSLRNGTTVNRWIRVRPLRTIDARHLDFAAQFEIDINTLPEDTSTKTARDVLEFLNSVRKHIEEDIPFFKNDEFVN